MKFKAKIAILILQLFSIYYSNQSFAFFGENINHSSNVFTPYIPGEMNINEDLSKAIANSHVIPLIADKWFDRGHKDIALEFDNAYLKEIPNMADEIADKWFDRGHKDIALEFDKIYLQKYPNMADEIADKWFDRRHKDIALEFDKIYLQKYPQMADKIADKWFDRRHKDIALEFDKIYLQKYPQMADKIADKWFDRGHKDIALEFDKIYLQKYPNMADEIVDKWFDRSEIGIVLNFNKLHPESALATLDKLIQNGNFVHAEEYANNILEFWVSQNNEEIQSNIDSKLKLAARIESSYYYSILKAELTDPDDKCIIHNYSKFFENLPLNPHLEDISITDYLAHRTFIHPDTFKAYNISIEEARMLLELDLYELIKKSDITFSVLHAIALHAKEDPYFKLHLFYEHPANQKNRGEYGKNLKRVNINSIPLRFKHLRGVLTHEWTHQLMHFLFENNCNPYPQNNEIAQNQWNKIMDLIWEKIDEAPEELKSLPQHDPYNDSYGETITKFREIRELYEKEDYDPEAIARFAEIIALDGYEDPRVQEFLQPIHNYWLQFIDPALDQYLKDHAKIDTFVSDWKRENVLNPLYTVQFDSDPYKSDLRIAKGLPQSSSIGSFFGDRWYAQGNINHAIEFDNIYLQEHPYMADSFADKWFERGDKDIAIEFDNAYLKEIPNMADEIADKWFDRGHKDIALEFDKIYLQKYPNMADEIANKWNDRGENFGKSKPQEKEKPKKKKTPQ